MTIIQYIYSILYIHWPKPWCSRCKTATTQRLLLHDLKEKALALKTTSLLASLSLYSNKCFLMRFNLCCDMTRFREKKHETSKKSHKKTRVCWNFQMRINFPSFLCCTSVSIFPLPSSNLSLLLLLFNFICNQAVSCSK